jgi:hypothetical protein
MNNDVAETILSPTVFSPMAVLTAQKTHCFSKLTFAHSEMMT